MTNPADFPDAFDSRFVTPETAAAVFGTTVEVIRSALGMEDYYPNRDGTIQFGIVRRCMAMYARNIPGARDDDHSRMRRMRGER